MFEPPVILRHVALTAFYRWQTRRNMHELVLVSLGRTVAWWFWGAAHRFEITLPLANGGWYCANIRFPAAIETDEQRMAFVEAVYRVDARLHTPEAEQTPEEKLQVQAAIVREAVRQLLLEGVIGEPPPACEAMDWQQAVVGASAADLEGTP